jgi:hypothetical protein
MACVAQLGRDNAEHGRPCKSCCIDSLGRISAGETLAAGRCRQQQSQ